MHASISFKGPIPQLMIRETKLVAEGQAILWVKSTLIKLYKNITRGGPFLNGGGAAVKNSKNRYFWRFLAILLDFGEKAS